MDDAIKKSKKRFIKEAFKLTLISIVLRAIGTGFMIYISNIIGSEGIGLYQITYSVYYLFITFSTSGISIAVTRLVSEQTAVGNTRSAGTSFKYCMVLCITLSVISMFLLYNLASPLSQYILKDMRALMSLKILAIGLPFLSIASTIRGYFLGIKKGVTASSTDIVEIFSQILITYIALKILAPMGIEYACCALVIGATSSEIISCIYACILYFIQKQNPVGDKGKGISKKIFSIVVPISISNYIRSTLNTIENIAMPQGLKSFGQNYGDALGQYGMIKGMVMPILLFPSCILSAFTNLLVPEVSSASAVSNKSRIDFIINKSFKVTLMFAFLVTGVFLCYSKEIGLFFYKDSKVGAMLLTLAPLVPLLYLDQIVDSILKGLNQQLSSMKYNSIDSVMRVLIILFLVPICGIKGYAIMLYAGTIFNAFLSINRLVVVGKVKFHMIRWVVLPFTAIVIACVITRLIMHTGLIINMFMVTLIYIIILVIIGCITRRDILWLKHIFIK